MANTTWSTTDKTASATLSGSNLIATASAIRQAGRAADNQSAGKSYWEVTIPTITGVGTGPGFATATANLTNIFTPATAGSNVAIYYKSNGIYVNGTSSGVNPGTIVNGNVVCIALDFPNQLIWFRLGAAGNWNNNAGNNPATGVGGISVSTLGGVPLYPVYSVATTSDQVSANFGDTGFAGAVPSGFASGFEAGGNAGRVPQTVRTIALVLA